jgi:hypothetical protein
LPELLSSFAIDNFLQRGGGYVSYRAMKETGAYRAVDFYNGRDPGSVADWSLGRELAEMLAKVAGDSSKLTG